MHAVAQQHDRALGLPARRDRDLGSGGHGSRQQGCDKCEDENAQAHGTPPAAHYAVTRSHQSRVLYQAPTMGKNQGLPE
jgi:hypothetical protein